MYITQSSSLTTRPPASPAVAKPGPEAANSQPHVRESHRDQLDVYNASRKAGNAVSGVVTGIAGHVGGNLGLLLPTVGETYRNLWRAETIGPYAKFVGSIVALAGIPMVAAGALLASPFQGIAEAFKGEATYPLIEDSSVDIAHRLTGNAERPATLLGKAIENMREFGDKKLAPGQQPWDIPVNKIFKGALDGLEFLMVKVPVQAAKLAKKGVILAKDGVVAGAKAVKKGAIETAKFTREYAPKLAGATLAGVTSALIAGPAGLLIGAGISVVLAARDIKHALTDSDRSLGSRVGGVAKTLAYIPVGPVMAGLAIKENFGRSFAEGWDGHPIEAIKTTGRAVIEKAKEALHPQEAPQASQPETSQKETR